MPRHDDKLPKWPFPEHGKLTAHVRRRWCKWIDGKTQYFGPWRNPDAGDEFARAALRRYLAYMHARKERKPVEIQPGDLTLHVAVNHYHTARSKHMQEGNLSAAQFVMYKQAGNLLLGTFSRDKLVRDMSPADFAVLRSNLKGGPVSVGNQIQWIRSILKWVGDFYGVLPRYDGQFNKPSKREVRRSRRPRALFEPAEIHALLQEASPALRAFILLGINCGFGQADCAKLKVGEVDWEKGVIAMERPKTGVQRVCPMWPETIKALRDYVRPNNVMPELFFITKFGQPWARENVHHNEGELVDRVSFTNSVALETRKLSKKVGVPERGFYTFRQTFDTIAEGAADPNALKVIMGHTFDGMDEFHLHLNRQPEFMARLTAVSEHVRTWLYGKEARKATKGGEPSR